ncbi:hypothetical protein L6164_017529 [Bauhinia variegata]|uniref:Uncharacterized protein n=1 Tax=Bauhinia variegata TaxID=167791 RepID=A0ACB9N824_BAUVA|nr:hypothetical protein L6164_017529 [Bauhinia variegata]
MNHQSSTSYYHILVTLIIILFISNLSTAFGSTKSKATISSNPVYKTYIQKACNTTRFPVLCCTTLYPFASRIKEDDVKLSKISLSLTLNATRSAYFSISNALKQSRLTHTEVAVVKDCVDNIKDAVYELRQSFHSIELLGGKDRDFQVSNIQTWVSAALTDEDTCIEGFNEQKVSPEVKNRIKMSVIKVARMTSNTLAFINSLTYSRSSNNEG